jgi:acetolactate synthase-1/2/3 large subunit
MDSPKFMENHVLQLFVSRNEDLKAAIQEMLDYPGPRVLDVATPYQEHVLPMIPGGHTVKDMIKE